MPRNRGAGRQFAGLYGKIEDGGRASRSLAIFPSGFPVSGLRLPETFHPQLSARMLCGALRNRDQEKRIMAVGAKIAKTADRKKVMDTSKSTDCPKCGKTTRIVKRMKDRERGVPGGIYISCSACEFFEKL
jgi:DNA-directed RNA polymerase subunit M/transcription elongation factor TFIIS